LTETVTPWVLTARCHLKNAEKIASHPQCRKIMRNFFPKQPRAVPSYPASVILGNAVRQRIPVIAPKRRSGVMPTALQAHVQTQHAPGATSRNNGALSPTYQSGDKARAVVMACLERRSRDKDRKAGAEGLIGLTGPAPIVPSRGWWH
jgi:hypothetical protein